MNKKIIFILIAGLITAFLIMVVPTAIVQAACTTAADGSINCDGANDNVTVSSGDTVPNVDSGAGNDHIQNDGNVTGNVNGSADDDVIDNSGTVGNELGGAGGNDTINNSGTAGTITGYNGDDVITNSGHVTNNITGGNDNDTITNTETGIVDGMIHAEGGNDTINNAGEVGDIIAGDGNDEVNNSGDVNGSINGYQGDDVINNSGTVDGSILGAIGNDTITNSGTVGNNIEGNTEDDTVILEDGASVAGIIDGGEDADNEDVDTLVFNFTTNDPDEYDQFNQDFASASPDSGSIGWKSQVYNWVNFELLQNLVSLIQSAHGDANGSTPEPAAADSTDCFFNDGTLVVCRYPGGDVAFLRVNEDEVRFHSYASSDEISSTQAGGTLFDNTDDGGYRLLATRTEEGDFSIELFPPNNASEDDLLALTGPDQEPRVYRFEL